LGCGIDGADAAVIEAAATIGAGFAVGRTTSPNNETGLNKSNVAKIIHHLSSREHCTVLRN
jgi:dihydroorotate dehydrogenase